MLPPPITKNGYSDGMHARAPTRPKTKFNKLFFAHETKFNKVIFRKGAAVPVDHTSETVRCRHTPREHAFKTRNRLDAAVAAMLYGAYSIVCAHKGRVIKNNLFEQMGERQLEDDVDALRTKLEIAELRNQVLEAQRKICDLEGVIDQQCNIIKENTALLIKQRLPPRPGLNPTAKALIAQQQNWMCCNPEGDCPRFKIADGRFGRDLYEIDHIQPFSRSGRHSGNLRGLCSYCHAICTRQLIASQCEADDTEE